MILVTSNQLLTTGSPYDVSVRARTQIPSSSSFLSTFSCATRSVYSNKLQFGTDLEVCPDGVPCVPHRQAKPGWFTVSPSRLVSTIHLAARSRSMFFPVLKRWFAPYDSHRPLPGAWITSRACACRSGDRRRDTMVEDSRVSLTAPMVTRRTSTDRPTATFWV